MEEHLNSWMKVGLPIQREGVIVDSHGRNVRRGVKDYNLGPPVKPPREIAVRRCTHLEAQDSDNAEMTTARNELKLVLKNVHITYQALRWLFGVANIADDISGSFRNVMDQTPANFRANIDDDKYKKLRRGDLDLQTTWRVYCFWRKRQDAVAQTIRQLKVKNIHTLHTPVRRSSTRTGAMESDRLRKRQQRVYLKSCCDLCMSCHFHVLYDFCVLNFLEPINRLTGLRPLFLPSRVLTGSADEMKG